MKKNRLEMNELELSVADAIEEGFVSICGALVCIHGISPERIANITEDNATKLEKEVITGIYNKKYAFVIWEGLKRSTANNMSFEETVKEAARRFVRLAMERLPETLKDLKKKVYKTIE